MADKEQFKIIRKGIKDWNTWRQENPDVKVDLTDAKLSGVNLSQENLSDADIFRVDIFGVDLREADLSGANLSGANLDGAALNGANLSGADLTGADLTYASLTGASLTGADLNGADLTGADLTGADLAEANLRGADLSSAHLRGTILCEMDLREVDLREADLTYANFSETYLDNAHLGKANLSGANLSSAHLSGANLITATLTGANLRNAVLRGADFSGSYLFGADLSRTDLRGADLSGAFLTGAHLTGADLSDANLCNAKIGSTSFDEVDLSTVKNLLTVHHEGPSSIGIDTIYKSNGDIPDVFLRGCGVPETFIEYVRSFTAEPFEYQSCFISYSHKDEEFAQRLHSRMRQEDLRVWYAPEDMRGGRKTFDQIDRAIQIHDRLLLILSENSMNSEWVKTEIRRARKVEMEENRKKLFPIHLVDFDAIEKWKCVDIETGDDLAVEVRKYHIPDFSNWKDHDAFEAGFANLMKDLLPDDE